MSPHAKFLRLSADEMLKLGVKTGWANTCSQAADEIDVLEQRLAAAEECLRSRNCDDLCLVHIQRAEAVEKERDEANGKLEKYRDMLSSWQTKLEAAETALQAAREAMREECCSAICPYCDGREVIYRDDVYWHNVARGGDLGTYQVCRAAAIRAIKP